MNQPIRAVGIPWYAAEHYAELKAMMEDGHKLSPTHAEWKRQAEKAESVHRGQGYLVVRAPLEPDAFREHCRRFGQKLDSQGRSHFAAWFAKQHQGAGD